MYLLLLAIVLETTSPADSSRLAVIGPAPDFTLIDQDGRPLARRELKGRVWLTSFLFTTCTGNCPETMQRLRQVQSELARRGLLRGQVRLVTITLDPERDQPETLRAYAQLYRADLQHWSFLTGSPATVRRVLDAWGMWTKRLPNGQLDHPSRVFLVDRQGRIREIYNLAFLRADWVAEDVALLLGEPPAPP